jgi:hypothetical protein
MTLKEQIEKLVTSRGTEERYGDYVYRHAGYVAAIADVLSLLEATPAEEEHTVHYQCGWCGEVLIHTCKDKQAYLQFYRGEK